MMHVWNTTVRMATAPLSWLSTDVPVHQRLNRSYLPSSTLLADEEVKNDNATFLIALAVFGFPTLVLVMVCLIRCRMFCIDRSAENEQNRSLEENSLLDDDVTLQVSRQANLMAVPGVIVCETKGDILQPQISGCSDIKGFDSSKNSI